MLQPIIDHLCKMGVVLASQSQIKKELLYKMGFSKDKLIIKPSNFDENLNRNDFATIEQFVEEIAYQKVLDVEAQLKNSGVKLPEIIIGADTVVTFNGKVFGKPKDDEEARQVLTMLSGKVNVVYTSAVLKINHKNETLYKLTDSTKVKFGELSVESIEEYIRTGEPLDKAGCYAIQGLGSTLIERIDGNMFTVMGIPVFKLANQLIEHYHV